MKPHGGGSEGRKLAPFAPLEAAPLDAGMWPAHPDVWLQLDLPPLLPEASGLHVERYHALPAPDLLPLEQPPADLTEQVPARPAFRAPDLRPALPEGGLAPLGWDPRAVCRKGDA